jgi:hypothetical protein
MLADAEWTARKNNRLKHLMRKVDFEFPGASLEDVEYREDRHVDKALITRLSVCTYVDERHKVFNRSDIFKIPRKQRRICAFCSVPATALAPDRTAYRREYSYLEIRKKRNISRQWSRHHLECQQFSDMTRTLKTFLLPTIYKGNAD